ncbi:MAG TPA: M15 family metallopeptidase [Bacteroidales bacterium]|jgi:D-alanyl-D-alanine dipeptidase|nr:M15 family metallopeptidase [Bacteroidales bacterium]HOL97099.1 M15 family metallopeptidase [Bacteroidales bacterium]HOM36008.1 M15 family metallopeptidase [Bacteroidales bacterium]HRS99454.1 M15 family metallopeptidase [Bacteroidales bacterium]HRT80315.1 M15 family metallopeptidase [Bacteroidales bacterium]
MQDQQKHDDVKNITIDTNIIDDNIPEKINKTEQYLNSIGLVNIKDSIPEIIVELKYSSEDNFLGFSFYGELKNAFVQPECFKKLKAAYKLLQDTIPGYTFIIYDAVRSIEAQQIMWDSIKVPEKQKYWYVANPNRGSIHNYGMAVDITLADRQGKPLDMGTGFDFFGELAFPDKSDYYLKIGELSTEQYNNRMLLLNIMRRAGFYVSKTEWWHFNATSLNDAKQRFIIFSEKNITTE